MQQKLDKQPPKEKRQHSRFSFDYPIYYKQKNNRGKKEAFLLNLSQGGCLFLSVGSLKKNSSINLEIPVLNKIFKLNAFIKKVDQTKGSRYYGIRASFDALSKIKIQIIEELSLINDYRDLKSRQQRRKVKPEEAVKDWLEIYSKKISKLNC